jgi:hypothetical protein
MKLHEIVNQNFESSCSVTPEYKKAKMQFRNRMKNLFGKDSVLIDSCAHFEISGFIKKDEKYVYFSTGDLRWKSNMLVRTAKHDRDFTGGHNNFISFNRDMEENLETLVNRLLTSN